MVPLEMTSVSMFKDNFVIYLVQLKSSNHPQLSTIQLEQVEWRKMPKNIDLKIPMKNHFPHALLQSLKVFPKTCHTKI